MPARVLTTGVTQDWPVLIREAVKPVLIRLKAWVIENGVAEIDMVISIPESHAQEIRSVFQVTVTIPEENVTADGGQKLPVLRKITLAVPG